MTDIQLGVPSARSAGRGFRAYSAKHLDTLVQRAGLPPEERLAVRAVATVLPFRTNSYVVEHLIDWAAGVDLLVVTTARPELLERHPGWGGGLRSKSPWIEKDDQYRQILRNVPLYRRAIDSGLPFPKTRRIVFEENKPASLPGWALIEIE